MWASRFLYKHVLPKYGINCAHCRSDGAGCFIASNFKSIIDHWEKMAGTVEKSYTNLVPGKGKTSLDGKFGIFTQKLHRLVDEGASFSSAEELYNLCVANPLKYTDYHLLQIQRDKVKDKLIISKAVDDLSLGRSHYLLMNHNGKVEGFCHILHGEGKCLPLLDSDKGTQ